MALSDKNSRRIQDYLDGSMSTSEQQEFEQDCARNERLAAELALCRSVSRTLQDREAFVFREQVSASIRRKQSFDNKALRVKQASWVGILLLLIITFIAAWCYYQSQKAITTKTPARQVKSKLPANPSFPFDSVRTDSTQVVVESNRENAQAALEQQPDRRIRDAIQTNPLKEVADGISYKTTYQQLALAEYQANTFIFRGTTSEAEIIDTAQQALSYFAQAVSFTDADRKQNYLEKVIELLNNTRVKKDERLLLTRAQAFFQTGRYSLAAADYQLLHDSFIYGHSADWGLTLCYLAQMPESEKAFQNALDLIINKTSHSFLTKALILQEKTAQIRE